MPPDNHPLRQVCKIANAALKSIEPLLSGIYAADISGGHPSIAPEKLLRATLLQIFYIQHANRVNRTLRVTQFQW